MWGPELGNLGGVERPAGSQQLARERLRRPKRGQEQQQPSPPNAIKETPGSSRDQGMARHLLQEGCRSSASSTGAQWYPPGRRPCPLQTLEPPCLTQLCRQSSVGTGCRLCPALMPPILDGRGERTGGRCAQVEEVLCSVAELWEEVNARQLACHRSNKVAAL